MTERKNQTTSEALQYSGGIYNLLGYDLRLLDRGGQLRSTYQKEPRWQPFPIWPAVVGYDTKMRELESRVLENVVPVGAMNGSHIELVQPAAEADVQLLIDFWRKARELGVRLRDMPDMKAIRKAPGMRQYCVVSMGVAIMAYLEGQEVERLLVPAQSLYDGTGRMLGCRSLIAMERVVS